MSETRIKKAGILSMQRIFNYGSFLQAFGLKSILEDIGCQVQFADYYPGECLVSDNGEKGFSRKLSKAAEVMKSKAPLAEKLRFIRYKKNYAKNYYPYLGIDESLHYAPDVDLLVIGSDEVFNCVQDNPNVGFSPELFGVGQTAEKVISYAASFGNTTMQKLEQYNVKDKVAGWLKELDAISVRDANSGEIIKELTGKDPVYNLDPVLMYDFVGKCSKIPSSVPETGYMILYGYSNRFTEEECRLIRQYADKKGLKIFCIGGVQSCCDKFIDCDPFTVIAYFQHADKVVTDTFHGTILSVITHRDFVSIVRSSGYGNSEKLIDLLSRLRLTNRKIDTFNDISSLMDKSIDYSVTDSIIKEEREKTYSYLRSFISAR